jgi:hypothetical protein
MKDDLHSSHTIAAILSVNRRRPISSKKITMIARSIGVSGKKINGSPGLNYTEAQAQKISDELVRDGRESAQRSIDARRMRMGR